ncbi:hypothetical protein AB0H57_05415 [Micromonospora sp. NPDC050686]
MADLLTATAVREERGGLADRSGVPTGPIRAARPCEADELVRSAE